MRFRKLDGQEFAAEFERRQQVVFSIAARLRHRVLLQGKIDRSLCTPKGVKDTQCATLKWLIH